MRTILFILALCVCSASFGNQVKVMSLKPQDVGTINTAVGFSTVIQLGRKPLNVVLGDQTAFRVEFINDSITLKPLRSGARSNLFIFTENDRFNLTVKSGSSSQVDYVVKLKRVFEDDKQTKILNRIATAKGLTLRLKKEVKGPTDRFVDFEISNLSKKTMRLNPEQFRVVAGQKPLALKTLYLESDRLPPGDTVSGSFSISGEAPKTLSSIWIGVEGRPLKLSFYQDSKLKGGILNAAR